MEKGMKVRLRRAAPPPLAGPESVAARRALIDAWGERAARFPEIRAAAGLALHAAGLPSPEDRAARAAAIERWVRGNVAYARERGEILETPLWVLRHRVGDCDGLAGLVLAMGRSVGLRGRAALLLREVEDAEGKKALTALHIFPQFWVRADSWVPADPGMPGSHVGESPGESLLRRGLIRPRL